MRLLAEAGGVAKLSGEKTVFETRLQVLQQMPHHTLEDLAALEEAIEWQNSHFEGLLAEVEQAGGILSVQACEKIAALKSQLEQIISEVYAKPFVAFMQRSLFALQINDSASQPELTEALYALQQLNAYKAKITELLSAKHQETRPYRLMAAAKLQQTLGQDLHTFLEAFHETLGQREKALLEQARALIKNHLETAQAYLRENHAEIRQLFVNSCFALSQTQDGEKQQAAIAAQQIALQRQLALLQTYDAIFDNFIPELQQIRSQLKEQLQKLEQAKQGVELSQTRFTVEAHLKTAETLESKHAVLIDLAQKAAQELSTPLTHERFQQAMTATTQQIKELEQCQCILTEETSPSLWQRTRVLIERLQNQHALLSEAMTQLPGIIQAQDRFNQLISQFTSEKKAIPIADGHRDQRSSLERASKKLLALQLEEQLDIRERIRNARRIIVTEEMMTQQTLVGFWERRNGPCALQKFYGQLLRASSNTMLPEDPVDSAQAERLRSYGITI